MRPARTPEWEAVTGVSDTGFGGAEGNKKSGRRSTRSVDDHGTRERGVLT